MGMPSMRLRPLRSKVLIAGGEGGESISRARLTAMGQPTVSRVVTELRGCNHKIVTRTATACDAVIERFTMPRLNLHIVTLALTIEKLMRILRENRQYTHLDVLLEHVKPHRTDAGFNHSGGSCRTLLHFSVENCRKPSCSS